MRDGNGGMNGRLGLRGSLIRAFALTAARLVRPLARALPPVAGNGDGVEAMGLVFPSPLGLAAGLDKNGDALATLADLGFGCIEVGTTTPRPEYGNRGAEILAANLATTLPGLRRRLGSRAPVIGVSIGMNAGSSPRCAVRDYLFGLEHVWAHADYLTVNLHGPSAAELMRPQGGRELEALLHQLKSAQESRARATARYVPLVAKIALAGGASHRRAAAAAHQAGFDGLLVSLNGPVTDAARLLREFAPPSRGEAPAIIAVGGVRGLADVRELLAAGAALVQIYSAFVGAPLIARRIGRALAR
jgi:dihydroorotate dehydrogenase